jgi:tetratricopeptide (TPR) repeat protein
LSTAVEKAAEAGLAEYLKDTEWASALVDWLHAETGISKVWLKLAVQLFAVLVGKAAAAAGSGASGLAARALGWLFARIPGSARIAQALAKLDRAKAAEVEFEAVLAGNLLPGDAKLTEHLSPTLRAQFVTQSRLHHIIDRLNPQPFLDFSCLDPETEAKRFVYTSRSVRLLGRERELEALNEFLNANTPFTWWVVEGPGGVGKSRLALEFALARSGPWRMGFVRGLREFGWQQWRPATPTVLIADYANETAEELGDITRGLAARAAQGDLAHPVRLLLLVREAEGAWKSQFLGTGGRRAAIEEARFADPLSISPLGNDALWEVLQSALPPDVPPPDRGETLAKLLDIDPQRRPLFALFAGDAIRNGRDLRQWDATALVNDVLEREKAHWKNAGATEKDVNLLALATMTGGMQTTMLDDLNPSLFPSTDGSVSPDAFDPIRYQAMVGGASAERTLSPLLPDILGERFVLDHLQPRYHGDVRRADDFRNTAWTINPEGMFAFLSRSVMDFPQTRTLPLLDQPPIAAAQPQRRAWAQATINLIAFYGDAGRLGDARRLYQELRAFAEAHAEDSAVRGPWAMAAFNLLNTYGNSGRVDEAREIYVELCALSEAHAPDATIREQRVRAAFNLLTDYASAGWVDKGWELYDELRILSKEHLADAVVQETRMKAAFNLLSACGTAGRLDEARELYAELRLLSESNPGDVLLREFRGMAVTNLLAAYGIARRADEARELYAELCGLSEAYAEDKAVRGERAKSTVNMLVGYGVAGRVDEAWGVYEEFRDFAKRHPNDQILAERFTVATQVMDTLANPDNIYPYPQ